MILSKKKPNRLCIYVFFDAQGKADTYVKYFLDKLQDCVQDIIVVVNGKMTDESKEYLKPYVKEILVRDNQGYDISAYKHGIQHVGYDKLKEYDEVIICNDTMFGPVYPFSDMFDDMASRDLDFWGITKHTRIEENVFENNFGYLPEHIQSYFIAFRNSLLQSDSFKEYWETLPLITDRDSAIGIFETLFTKHFADLGFKWATYVDGYEFMGTKSVNPCFNNPDLIVIKDKCPVFKKKLFLLDYDHYNDMHVPNTVSNLYDYLLSSGLYDVSMIWENILRTGSQADYLKNLQLNFAVSSRRRQVLKAPKYKCATLVKIVDLKKIKTIFECLSKFGKDFDIYVVTNHEQAVLEHNKNYGLNIKKIVGVDNSFGYMCQEYLKDYDIACNIDTTHILNRDFYMLDNIADNIVGSEIQIYNTLNLFSVESHLGMLCFADKNTILKQLKYYRKHYDAIKEKATSLKLNVPVKKEKCHIIPQENCFWFRPNIFNKVETFDDSITSIYYSLIAQDAGYFTAYVRNNSILEIESIGDIQKLTCKVFHKSIFTKFFTLVKKAINYWKKYGFVRLVKKTFRFIKKKLVKKKDID